VGKEAKETSLECRSSGDKGVGEYTPFEPKSSGGDDEEEDEEEGKVTSPPHSPPPEDLPLLGDFFGREARMSVCVRRPSFRIF
jgi:hypothetical protein